MDARTLDRLGLSEIVGSEVYGGEALPWPFIIKAAAIVFTAAVTAIVANCDDFTNGVSQGYNDAVH